MAFNPQWEDYQRMGLRFARSLDGLDAAAATRAFASFSRLFARDRDTLPQTDADRAFHLVSVAAGLVDQELPMATDEDANHLIDDARRMLDEAIQLDAACHDAIRMCAIADAPSFGASLDYLDEHAGEVRASCEAARKAALEDESGERARLAADIAMRPYLRWLAMQASSSLICGRNRRAIAYAEQALEVDPKDSADVRFTATLAYAKLEDDAGLDAFETRVRERGVTRPANDAWTYLARLSLAHKRRDFADASRWLEKLLVSYPHAAQTLWLQTELPEGTFARLAVAPCSEDELILAVSEATVLLQEGVDLVGKGILSTWVQQEVAARVAPALLDLVLKEAQQAEEGVGR